MVRARRPPNHSSRRGFHPSAARRPSRATPHGSPRRPPHLVHRSTRSHRRRRGPRWPGRSVLPRSLHRRNPRACLESRVRFYADHGELAPLSRVRRRDLAPARQTGQRPRQSRLRLPRDLRPHPVAAAHLVVARRPPVPLVSAKPQRPRPRFQLAYHDRFLVRPPPDRTHPHRPPDFLPLGRLAPLHGYRYTAARLRTTKQWRPPARRHRDRACRRHTARLRRPASRRRPVHAPCLADDHAPLPRCRRGPAGHPRCPRICHLAAHRRHHAPIRSLHGAAPAPRWLRRS